MAVHARGVARAKVAVLILPALTEEKADRLAQGDSFRRGGGGLVADCGKGQRRERGHGRFMGAVLADGSAGVLLRKKKGNALLDSVVYGIPPELGGD